MVFSRKVGASKVGYHSPPTGALAPTLSCTAISREGGELVEGLEEMAHGHLRQNAQQVQQ